MAGYVEVIDGTPGDATMATETWSKQVVMRFATGATRDTALAAVKVAGMYAHLLDSNTLTWWDGTNWRGVKSIKAGAVGAAGTTSATTIRTVASYTLPAQAVAGNVTGSGLLYFTQSVSTDVFHVYVYVNGSLVAQYFPPVITAPNHTAVLSGDIGVAAGGAGCLCTLQIQRTTGTGTATLVLDGTLNRLDVRWDPT